MQLGAIGATSAAGRSRSAPGAAAIQRNGPDGTIAGVLARANIAATSLAARNPMTDDKASETAAGLRLGAHRFRFAVIADSHCEPGPNGASAECRSNSRTRRIVAAINRIRPEFVIHLGDVVHPVPALPTFQPAALAANGIIGQLERRCYITPGNHDIGDKPAFLMPAATATPDWVSLYEAHFGPAFQSFDSHDLHVVLFNSPILNTGVAIERAQRDWLEADLRRNRGKRIWLFTHYPPYLRAPSEESHYDNIDEPARSWLLSLMETYRVEAMLSGHVHNFFYNRLGGTEIYLAPSTSFARRDFAELYRVAPSDEFGKNDPGKLGWFLVDVHENGHVVRFERSDGVRADAPAADPPRRQIRHPKEGGAFALGAHLRHPWSEVVELPYGGPVAEFQRRLVRNDYPIAAFWDMGLRSLRVPLHDLARDDVRRRMQDLTRVGHRFTVFTAGAPDAAARARLVEHAGTVHAFEVVLAAADLAAAAAELAGLRREAGVKVYVAPLQTTADDAGDVKSHGSSFKHHVSHGFTLELEPSIRAFLEALQPCGAIDGLVFRVRLSEDPAASLAAIAGYSGARGFGVLATVCLGGDGPNDHNGDDDAIARRVARAAFAAHALQEMDVYLDTFADMDRGYGTRHGLVDRRFNRRAAGCVLRNLAAVLAQAPAPGAMRFSEDGAIALRAGPLGLALADGSSEVARLPMAMGAGRGVARVVDLLAGGEQQIAWRGDSGGLALERPARRGAPSLVLIDETGVGSG